MSDLPQPPGAAIPPGWEGILEPGERILWQGQPDSGIRLDGFDLRRALPGLAMAAFALFWMWGAAQANPFLTLFGLIFLFLGLRQALAPLLAPAFIRARSFYTLTDRRAIIGTDLPFRGRRLASHPIDAGTPLEYLASDPPSILFGAPGRDPDRRAGFTFIPEADRVMALMRQIQRGQTPDQPAPKDAQP